MEQTQQKQGAFFVIDGSDGSGKATQTKLLVAQLTQAGHDVETIAFPQYGKHSARMLEAYLAGDYGKDASQIDPRAASILFAVDRFDASFQIREWLQAGKIVIADRYVASNMGHQGSKIADPLKRSEYLAWNDNLEHEIFKIPRPTTNIILSVPADVAQKLAQKGAQEKTKVEGDIHENDMQHLYAAEATYREIAHTFPNFRLIECTEGGELRSIESIHQEIWELVNRLMQPTLTQTPAKTTA